MNTMMKIGYKNLKVDDFVVSYEDLKEMKYEDLLINQPVGFFDMIKEFAKFMVDRVEDLDESLTAVWPINMENAKNETVYGEVLDVLKKSIDLKIKNRK